MRQVLTAYNVFIYDLKNTLQFIQVFFLFYCQHWVRDKGIVLECWRGINSRNTKRRKPWIMADVRVGPLCGTNCCERAGVRSPQDLPNLLAVGAGRSLLFSPRTRRSIAWRVLVPAYRVSPLGFITRHRTIRPSYSNRGVGILPSRTYKAYICTFL